MILALFRGILTLFRGILALFVVGKVVSNNNRPPSAGGRRFAPPLLLLTTLWRQLDQPEELLDQGKAKPARPSQGTTASKGAMQGAPEKGQDMKTQLLVDTGGGGPPRLRPSRRDSMVGGCSRPEFLVILSKNSKSG